MIGGYTEELGSVWKMMQWLEKTPYYIKSVVLNYIFEEDNGLIL